MSKHKGRSKGSKTSHSKLANKKFNRLAKQGKLKKKKKKDKESKQQSLQDTANDQTGKHDENVPLDDEDVGFYSTPGQNSFVKTAKSRLLNGERPGFNKKRPSSEIEENYESLPRKVFAGQSNEKALLPIKTKKGIIPQSIKEEPEETNEEPSTEDTKDTDQEPVEPLPVLSNIQMLVNRQHKLQERKKQIALLASAIIENPEENTKKLKELRLLLEENDPDVFITVRKLVMYSLMEIFKDIIPGYRIRLLTQTEKQQKMKKETKSLYDYEQSLLMNYKGYLEFLEKYCTGKHNEKTKKQRRNGVKTQDIPPEVAEVFTKVAVHCMCEMLSTHPHFNYRTNIITVLVPLMNKQKPEISDTVCHAISKVFSNDKSGEVSLEIVRLIGKMIKARDFKIQRKVLDTFLSLKIKEIDMSGETKEKKKKKREMMSRKERKKRKKMATLEHELLETKATEDKNKKLQLHTEIIGAVFLVYFRILKNYRSSSLLPAVLEGLARFAHLINIDFFDDLYKVFNELIEAEELTYRESLHVILTAFTILCGQGSALNIDPMNFYTHMYNTLMHIHAGNSSEDMPLVIDCIHCMMNRRKRLVSQQRILAYTKRLSTLCLHQLPSGTMAYLALIRNFMLTYKYTEILFDNESQGSGVYLPELMEPEHCHAQNTMLWELSFLKKHYHPGVQKYAVHVARMAPVTGEGQLPVEFKSKSPKDLYEELDKEELFSDKVLSKATGRHKRKKGQAFLQKELVKTVESVMGIEHDSPG